MINVSEVQNNARAHVMNNISHVEQMIVSGILHTIRIHIGPVGTNVSEVQNSVRVHVVLDIFCVEWKIANGTQPLTENTIEPVGTNV